MNLMEFKNEILKQGNIFPIIFTGIEVGIMDIYINEICHRYKIQLKRIDSFQDALNISKQKSLFGNQDFLYVIKNDKNFYRDDNQWQFLENQGKRFVFIYDNIDNRTKFFKEFEDKIIIFDSLDAKQLARYIIKDTGLNKEYAEEMALNCGLDYLTIKMEIDKLLRYKKIFNLSIDNAYLKAVNEKILQIRWDDLFEDFVNLVMRRDITLALQEWEGLKECGESELKALAYIYNSFKQLLLVKCEQANLYFTNLLKPFVKLYEQQEIEDIIYILQKLELEVKTGRLELNLLVDYILVSIG